MSLRLTRAVRACLTISVAALLVPAVRAASFDCGAASSPIEHAICDDPQLSALDSELAVAYRNAVKGQGGSADRLRAEQRAWLKSRALGGKADLSALKEAYRARIDELKTIPAFPSPEAPVEGPAFRLTRAAKRHDFVLRMLEACDEPSCEGPAQLLVYGKGQTKPLQTINLSNVVVSRQTDGGAPIAKAARGYDDEGVMNVGDFDFDGYEDFAVQTTDHEGSYGGPSYEVYLFEPKTGRFAYNDAMTGLALESLGFFDVDAAHKRIRTFAKGGCCYHVLTTYEIQHDVPIAVARHTEDALNAVDGKMQIIDEQLVNGKWRKKIRYEPLPD